MDLYKELHEGTPHIDIQKENAFRDVQIKAINRALNILMSLLKYRGVITENELGWINYLKNDPKLTVSIDKEDLLRNFLDIASRVPCPKNYQDALDAIRNHRIIGPPTKKILNPLTRG